MIKSNKREKPTFGRFFLPEVDKLFPDPEAEPDASLHREKTFLTAMDIGGLKLFDTVRSENKPNVDLSVSPSKMSLGVKKTSKE
jgi:hypothetical protein